MIKRFIVPLILSFLFIFCSYTVFAACVYGTYTVTLYSPSGVGVASCSPSPFAVSGSNCRVTTTASCNFPYTFGCTEVGWYYTKTSGHEVDQTKNVYYCDYDDVQAACVAAGFVWTGRGGNLNCCGDDANEYYITGRDLTSACCDTANECVIGGECKNYAYTEGTIEIMCDDGVDNDCDGLIDCDDSDCGGKITGYVKDQENKPLDLAKVEALKGLTKVAEVYTQPNGYYEIDIACGTYNLIASKDNYISYTKSNVYLAAKTTLENQNLQLTYGIVCEEDCTYLLDDRCHKECNGIAGCSFYDASAMDKCNLAKIGWEVGYNENYIVECCEGSPQEKTAIKAVPSCPYGNLVKFYRIVYYKGKPIRMVTVVCGD